MWASTHVLSMDSDKIETAVLKAAEILHFSPLKPEQKLCLEEFVKGRDVFVILPTGYGKTVCYACVPVACDIYHNKPCGEESIIIVVSPLIALIKDQVNNLTKHGISVGYVDAQSGNDVKEAINNGKYSIIFMSPDEFSISKMACCSDSG